MTPLVGRRREIDRATLALDGAGRGRASLLWVSGEPGIGKSRFAREVAAIAEARGDAVFWGRCWEAGGAPAYWPWIQVFRALGCDPFSGVDRGGGSLERRFELFEAARRMLDDATKETTALIVLDDLHAADVPSLLLLLFVARHMSSMRAAILGAARDPVPSEDAAPLIAKLRREAESISLARLTAGEVAAWAGPREVDAAEIFRVSEGNPLFVEELLRVGIQRSAPHHALAGVLDEHLAKLDPAVREMLEAASVLGREISLDAMERAFGAPADDLARRADEAVAAAVLLPVERGVYAFTHVLLRDRLHEAMSPMRRAELHWKAGLAARDKAVGAHHLVEGHAAGDAAVAARAAREAANDALVALAFEEAAALAMRGLAIVPPRSELACDLELVKAEALVRAGESAKGREACLHAAGIAEALDAAELMARAALVYGTDLITAARDETMVTLLERALARLPQADGALRARVMARLAAALTPLRDDASASVVGLAREAFATARRLGDKATLLSTLDYGGPALGYIIGAEERAAILAETVVVARELGQRISLERSLGMHIVHLLWQGRRAEANVELKAFADMMRAMPSVSPWRLPALLSTFALMDGRMDDALRLSRESRALGGKPATVTWALQRVAVAQALGDHTSIAPDAEEVLAVFGSALGFSPHSAWVIAATGDPTEATTLLSSILNAHGGFPAAIIAGATCAMVGDRELAEIAFDSLARHRADNPIFWGPAGGVTFGPTARVLADLALLLGRRDEAAALYEEAMALTEGMGAKSLTELARRGRAACGAPSHVTAPARAQRGLKMKREGELWTLEAPGGPLVRMKHSKGLAYLDQLVACAGREVHVLVLIGAEHGEGDAGAILDARSKAEYQSRIEALEDRIEVARSLGDSKGVARAEDELDALAQQLASAVGLGGRDRKAAAGVERARINVQRRLKDTIEAIAGVDRALGRYLAATVKTGTFCSFMPV